MVLAAALGWTHIRAVGQDGPAPVVVRAPHYGDTLFHFYQERYFGAITGLMVSQHFGRVAPHDDGAEVLRGGMLLSYGMHPQAAEVFARLIERNALPAVRDRAWFHLARIRHQRGLLADAEEALGRIAAPLPAPLEDDRHLLHAQLLLARQDHAGAAAVLQALQASPTAGLYARFNLGVALVRGGEPARGKALLDEVGRSPAIDEEQRSLRDRANVALGFAALQSGQPRDARQALQRVRLSGTQSNKALLGFGWAAAELKDPQLALAPWTELAGRSLSDAAVLEAHIALPYAMAEIGAHRRALDGYHGAIARFESEQRSLDEAIAAIHAGQLVQALLARSPAEAGLGATLEIAALPEMPHAAHLAPLLAGHGFQETYKHLRDLQYLGANLAQWQGSLGSFGDMLDNRRQAFAERLPSVRARAGAVDLPALQQRRDALAAELQAALRNGDAAAFANTDERALQQRVERGQATLAAAGTDPALAEARERLRRAAGALTWQLTRELPQRGWLARKALRDSDSALAEARERDAALLRAQRAEPARQARFAARIAELGARLDALVPRVTALAAEAQGTLQGIAVAELESQKERLDVYTAQARLAIAQIHDRAPVAQRGATAELPR